MDILNRVNLVSSIEHIFDKRTANWPLMQSPLPTLFVCLAYVYFVKNLGPKLMKDRKPFQFRKLLIVYNLMHVLISAYLFWEAGRAGWFGKYSFFCEPYSKSTDEQTMRMVKACYLYYLSKFAELFDTVFFVLRKRNDQISVLHVIHHGLMPFAVWFGVRLAPSGHLTFFGFINVFVHIIMYSYYMLAAIGPHMQKYLWWKKYLTRLQIVQFILVFVHALQLRFRNPCNYPAQLSFIIMPLALMFLGLFTNFYWSAYLKNRREKLKESDLKKIE